MIRCLHVIDHLGLGGAQSSLLDLVTHLNPESIHSEVAAMHGKGPFARALEEEGVTVHSLAGSRVSPSMVPNLLALARRGSFDVFHFHLPGSNWLAKPVLALAGHSVRVAHDHSSGDLKFRGLGSLVPDAVGHLFSDRVLAVSGGVRDFLIRWEALPSDLVEVVPNGVNTASFSPPDTTARQRARTSFGVKDGEFLVGAMGRFSPEKNFVSLPEIAGLVPGAVFLLAGEGPERDRIEAAIAASSGRERVRIVGRIEDRQGFYAALDAFVLPSFHEGLPMVLLEAMASAIPTVASRLPDIASALDEGHCGLLADPRRPESFSAALHWLACDPGLRFSMGSRARSKCERFFSAAISAAAVEHVYFDLLKAEVAQRRLAAISQSR